MKFTTSVTRAVILAAAGITAKELPKDELRAAQLYDNGKKHMMNMEIKLGLWRDELASGAMNSSQWPELGYTKCVNGIAEAVKGDAAQTYKCKNIDLYHFLPHSALGSPETNSAGEVGSSSWGWTDPESGREFVASGMYAGVGLIEILPHGKMQPLALLKCPIPLGENSLWKEVRGYKHYMLIGSELIGHNVQIFDMRKLLTLNPADGIKYFDGVTDVTGTFKDMVAGRCHNVLANEEREYGVAVGARPRSGQPQNECNAGLQFFDLKDPSNPKTLGCNGKDGYVHDAQCVVYRGPDTKYLGRDICYAYNEDTLTIYDVTDKANSSIISVTSYEGATYTHQGWLLDVNNQEYLIMDDEYDEYDVVGPAADGYPVTYIWDIRSLEKPKNTGLYKGTVKGIDHNQYVIDGLSWQSSYINGLRVYDVSSIPSDPTGGNVCEIAYFDIYPEDDNLPGGGDPKGFFGSWSSYAYFKSGYVFINTIERGAWLVKMTKRERCKQTCNADNCLRAMRNPDRLAGSQQFCGEFTKTFVADVSVVPDYASKACQTNVISRVSSACKCLPTAS